MVTAPASLVATVAIPNPTVPYVLGGMSATGTVSTGGEKAVGRRQHDDMLAGRFIKVHRAMLYLYATLPIYSIP